MNNNQKGSSSDSKNTKGDWIKLGNGTSTESLKKDMKGVWTIKWDKTKTDVKK